MFKTISEISELREVGFKPNSGSETAKVKPSRVLIAAAALLVLASAALIATPELAKADESVSPATTPALTKSQLSRLRAEGLRNGLRLQTDEELKNYLSLKSLQYSTRPPTQREWNAVRLPMPTPAPLPQSSPQRPGGYGNPGLPGATDTAGGIVGGIAMLIQDLGNVQGWMMLGSKLWDLIQAGRPSLSVKTQRVTVVPNIAGDWTAMSDWQGPYAQTYVIEAKNYLGMSVIKQVYTIAFNYGGKYNGQGQFLANATIIPVDVKVGWGFSLDSSVEFGEPVNLGSLVEPKAGLELQIVWKMGSVFSRREGRDSFFVRGDGTSQQLTATSF